MRPFDLDSILLMSAVLDKTGLDVSIRSVFDQIKTKAVEKPEDLKELGKEFAVSAGVQVMTALFKNAHKAGSEIKELVAHLTEKTPQEAGKMSLKEIKGFFTELVKAEGFGDFFKQAAGWTD